MPASQPTPVPREVPYDPEVPEDFRDKYIRISTAAKIAGVHEGTIQRHLRNGTLAGIKLGERLWYVRRETEETEQAPAIDLWEPGKPGNPQWRSGDS
jgi:excisionase family DNA binding protein